MKYIIEIEDEPLWRQSALYGENAVFKAKNFNALVFDKEGLDKLTPLDKELEEAYQQGLEDMHKAIEKISNMSAEEKEAVFDGQTLYYAINEYTTNGIMEKLAAYEEQQKADEIKVGDEVYAETSVGKTEPFVVLKVYDNDVTKYYSLFGNKCKCQSCSRGSELQKDRSALPSGRRTAQGYERRCEMNENQEYCYLRLPCGICRLTMTDCPKVSYVYSTTPTWVSTSCEENINTNSEVQNDTRL